MENSKETVKCVICLGEPGWVKQILGEDQVYWSLQCDCKKNTPFLRGREFVVFVWESQTHKLSVDEAKEVFDKSEAEFST